MAGSIIAHRSQTQISFLRHFGLVCGKVVGLSLVFLAVVLVGQCIELLGIDPGDQGNQTFDVFCDLFQRACGIVIDLQEVLVPVIDEAGGKQSVSSVSARASTV